MLDLEHGILMFIFGVSFTFIGFFIAFLVINYNHRKKQKKKMRVYGQTYIKKKK